MGCRDARSDYKRQTVLTGKARLIIQFVCEKKQDEKSHSHCICFPFYQIKNNFEDTDSNLLGMLVSHVIIDFF